MPRKASVNNSGATYFNVTHSITIMTDGCTNFRKFVEEGTQPNQNRIDECVERSLMLVTTALSPVISFVDPSQMVKLMWLPLLPEVSEVG